MLHEHISIRYQYWYMYRMSITYQ